MLRKLFFSCLLFMAYVYAGSLDDIVKRGELRVGTDPGYIPFEMKDKKGNVIGFDIDIAKKMADDMGVKLKVIPTAWDGIIPSLITDKFDIIIAGMTITQERNLKVNFANPYIVIGQTLLVSKNIANKYSSYKEFDSSKYTVTTKLGTTGEIAARKFFKNAKIKTFDSEAEAVQELLNGKADAFIYDHPFNAIFHSQKGKGKIVHWDTPLTYEPLGWAIKKGDVDFLNWLDNFLVQIKNDGTYDKIYYRWFKSDKWQKRVQ